MATQMFGELDPEKRPQPQGAPDPGSFGGFQPLGGGAAPASFQPLGGGSASAAPAPSAAAPAPAPAAPAPAPAQAGAMDPNAVWGNLTNQFQTKFGRAMSADEAKALQGYAGYTGGAINQSMIDKATQGISSYTGNLANPFGPATPAAPTTPAAAPAAPVEPAAQTENVVQQQLQQLLTEGSTPALNAEVETESPAFQAQRANFDRQNETARGRERLAAAERTAARNGLGAGGYDANLMAADTAAGDRKAGFESDLMRGELEGQRERIMQAMGLAAQSGNAAQGRALQERLAQVDATLRREGYNVQREGMTMQNKLGQGQLGLGLLQSLLGDRRAGDQLGFNYAALGQQANQGLLNSILQNL